MIKLWIIGGIIIERQQLKTESKQLLHGNLQYFLLLCLPLYLIYLFYMIVRVRDGMVDPNSESSFRITFEFSISFFISILTISISWNMLDVLRGRSKMEAPLEKSLGLFTNGKAFLDVLAIAIISGFFIFLWTLLLVVPGIIKGFAYSQAYFIYKDAKDQGQEIGYLEAITKSRQLMDGHKADYFVLSLSFIGWYLLLIVTAGLLGIWLVPYYQLTLANFYRHLTATTTDNDHSDEPQIIEY